MLPTTSPTREDLAAGWAIEVGVAEVEEDVVEELVDNRNVETLLG